MTTQQEAKPTLAPETDAKSLISLSKDEEGTLTFIKDILGVEFHNMSFAWGTKDDVDHGLVIYFHAVHKTIPDFELYMTFTRPSDEESWLQGIDTITRLFRMSYIDRLEKRLESQSSIS